MGTLWISGAERLPVSSAGGTITSTAPPRVVWHATEAQPGTANVWTSMIRVLNNKAAEPQVLYDPVADRLGQFMPLNVSGRALKNDGTVRTNRVGKVCIQVEVIAYSAKPFTAYWKPGPNWRALMAAIRSWGIPDVQPAGAFPKFIDSPPHNVPESPRSRTTWTTTGGHFSHAQIPGNDHGDPGAVSFPAMLAAAPKTTTPPGDVKPPPAKDWFDMATKDDLDELLEKWTVSREHWDSQAWAYLAVAIAAAQKSMEGVDVTPAMVTTAQAEARAALSVLEASFG
jgi:hypothetical protein